MYIGRKTLKFSGHFKARRTDKIHISPRWGLGLGSVLRFYRHFAPLGLCFLFSHAFFYVLDQRKKTRNIRRVFGAC